jgi:DNA-directed RNA polymerase subunit RPC12/RpoP
VSDPVSEDRMMDGNMLGGPLSEIFTVDATMIIGKCIDCGWSGPLAETRVYMGAAPVARCPQCGRVLLVLVKSEDVIRLDVSGLASLQISRSSPEVNNNHHQS